MIVEATSGPVPPAKWRIRHSVVLVLLLLSVWLVYSGNGDHQLLHWDDMTYVSNNPWVTNPSSAGVSEMFTESRAGNWHPLTWLSYVPEYALYEDNAACYKLSNLLLHWINSLLVYLLALTVAGRFETLRKPSLPGKADGAATVNVAAAATAALLYAVHPQHVESVTWVAERKDLLCALFYFGALVVYLRGGFQAFTSRYWLTLVLFLMALMSKSMAVTLPLALVLLDALVLERLSRPAATGIFRITVTEKLPFYLLMLAVVFVTLQTQNVERVIQPSLVDKLAISLSAVQYYLLSFLYPQDMAPFHPVEALQRNVVHYLPLLALLAGFGFGLRFEKARRPLLLAGGFFLLTLMPVIGVVKVGEQLYADRYTYIPMAGFYCLAGYVAMAGITRAGNRSSLLALVSRTGLVAVLVLFGLVARGYKEVWRDDFSVWRFVVQRYPLLAVTPYNNLGNSYYEAGQYATAAEFYEQSLAIDPQRTLAYANLAAVYQVSGHEEKVLETYLRGVRNNPDNAAIRSRTGIAYLSRGEAERAEEFLSEALLLLPEYPEALLGMARLYLLRGEVNAAIANLEAIPANAREHLEAGLLLAQARALSDRNSGYQTLRELRARYGDNPAMDEVSDWIEKL